MTKCQNLTLLSAIFSLSACGGSETGASDATDADKTDPQEQTEADASEESESEAVTRKGTHYEIQFPTGWKLKVPPPNGVDSIALSPSEEGDDFQENLNVVIEQLPQPMTTPEFAMAVTSGMQQLIKGFSLISTNEVRLKGGTQAIEAVYKSNFQQELHHIAVMLADKSKRGFVITGTATPDSFPKFAPVFRKSAKSFKIKP